MGHVSVSLGLLACLVSGDDEPSTTRDAGPVAHPPQSNPATTRSRTNACITDDSISYQTPMFSLDQSKKAS